MPQSRPINGPTVTSVDTSESGSIYDRYVAAKEGLGLGVRIDRSEFEAQLERQRTQLEDKLGRKVQFEVRVEDGKVKLAARKVRKRESNQ